MTQMEIDSYFLTAAEYAVSQELPLEVDEHRFLPSCCNPLG